jgi:hypothetical protein
VRNASFIAVWILAWFGFGASPAAAVDWETAIERVQQASEDYFEYASEVGGTSWAGTMYNGYEFDRHQCAIVGRMLGLQDVIVDLETMPYPPMDQTSDPHDLLVFSISLENWVLAARRALAMDDGQLRYTWNLDCVGALGISTAHYIENPNPNAQFRAEGDTLYVYGAIDFGFYDRFEEALRGHPLIRKVALGSGGGSVRDAILAGLEIRTLGLDTTIYGNCSSACPLVFMGGRNRVIWANSSRLGFHQVSRLGVAIPHDDDTYGRIAAYLNLMGIEANAVIRWMLAAPPEEMHIPPVAELCSPGAATWVQRVCPDFD